jgi:soluble lytic murein transglycosylase-like protein
VVNRIAVPACRRVPWSARLLAVALAGAITSWPGPQHVSGSVPAAMLPPRVAMLESQGELQLALQALDADTLAAAEAENLLARLRYACRRGDFAAARALLDAHPDGFAADATSLVRAALAAKLNEPQQCLAALSSAPAPAGLEAYAAWLEAEAATATAQWERAAGAAERVRDAGLPMEMRQRLQVVRGFVALQRRDLPTLRRVAPDLGEAARRDDRTGLLLLAAARAAADSGQTVQARDWLLDLLEARPTPADSAYAELGRRGERDRDSTTSVVLRLARYETRSSRCTAARTRLEKNLAARHSAAARRALWLPLAESALRAGEPASALAVLERAAGDLASTSLEPERLRLRARALRRLGRNADARACYQELARRFPSHRVADDALYEIGWLQENEHQLGAAERAYVRCVHTFPHGSLADDASLRAGLCALRDHRPADASEHLAALVAQHPTSALADNALYWEMLAQVQLGDPTGALGLRDRLERSFPRSYFTLLARQRVEQGLVPPQSAWPESATAAVPLHTDDGWERAQRIYDAYENALATLRPAPGLQPPTGLESEMRLWRFLLDHGLAVEASWEARRLEKRYEDQPGALLEMIATAHARGAHERLVRWAYRLGQRLPDGASREAAEVLLFPAPYACSVAAIAARHQLSHATVLGLIRQESAFDPRADSGAGARGLMQLMPEVGRRLAATAPDSTAWHADRLYDAGENLELGCTLLADELRRAGARLPQALAAYNAGGDLAHAWAARLGPQDPPELYIDVAEYAETRTYLKTVLGNIETYRRLYALP